jgi:hypothetical protein
MIRVSNIHYEVSDKARGLGVGGVGLIHALVRRFGLAKVIDERLHLLKVHLPYHESDHVLNIAYNLLCGSRTRRRRATSAGGSASRRSRP